MVGPTHPAMKCLVITAVLLLILLGCSGPSGQSEDPEGQWVGSFEVAEGPVYLQLGLQKTTKGTNLAARFMLPGPPSPVAQFRLEPPLLHFELPTGSDKLVFSGEILGQTISGTVLSEGKQGTFKLVREAQVDPEVYDDYIGTYELDEPGGVVFIGRYDQLNQEPPYPLEKSALYYVKESGRTGVLFPSSDTSFFSGTTFFAPVPIEVEATFVRNENGKVTGLLWNQEGSDGAKAARSRAYSEEEVVFQNGEVTLAGRLLVPSTAGPHPAVVVISGGNGIPVNRNQGYQIVGDVFARRGIAALIYDKRGGGRSTGDWRTAGPEELAADALAAVHFLRGRGDIDPNQVGLWGISEGGWIGPLTASRCEEVAFLIVVSADGTPRFDSNLRWLQDQWLPADGFSPDEIEQAVSFSRLEHEFCTHGKAMGKTRSRR